MSQRQGYRAGWCIHYRHNRDLKPGEPDTCKAGVDLDQLKGTKLEVRPCFLDGKTGESKPNAMACEKLRRPTSDEIAMNEVYEEKQMAKFFAVREAVLPWRKAHKGKSASEVVECPACSGRLHLSISAYNGHVHGHCETVDCVSWME